MAILRNLIVGARERRPSSKHLDIRILVPMLNLCKNFLSIYIYYIYRPSRRQWEAPWRPRETTEASFRAQILARPTECSPLPPSRGHLKQGSFGEPITVRSMHKSYPVGLPSRREEARGGAKATPKAWGPLTRLATRAEARPGLTRQLAEE